MIEVALRKRLNKECNASMARWRDPPEIGMLLEWSVVMDAVKNG
jgi:hypothetical protein